MSVPRWFDDDEGASNDDGDEDGEDEDTFLVVE